MSDIEIGSVWVRKDCDLISARVVGFAADKVVVVWRDGGCGTEMDCDLHISDFLHVYKLSESEKPIRVTFSDRVVKMLDKRKHSHYHKDVSKYKTMDIYAICKVWNAEPSGCTHHALKKLLHAGERGAKSKITDLEQSIESIEALIKLEKMDIGGDS